MSGAIQTIVMPKWGLAMQEGALTKWLVAEGATIKPGVEVCEIETSKITNALESTIAGTIRRRIADEGVVLPVGALLAVVADRSVDDAAIDAFVAKFNEEFAAAVAAAGSEAPGPQSIDVGGRGIQYQRAGEGGIPIVFLHGFGGDLNGWMFNQPVLAGSRATVALDLPGHGGSSKDVGNGSVELFAAIVADALDGLEIERAHLVGHSLGGAIAASVAAAHPEKVAALTLIASAGLGAEINIGFIDGFIAASGRKDLLPVLQTLFADPALVTRDMVNETLKFKRLDGVDQALRTIAGAAFPSGKQASSLRDRLASLSMPVQLIFGADDRIIPASHAGGLPGNVKVHVLPAAGHVPQMEKAGDVNQLIGSFGPSA